MSETENVPKIGIRHVQMTLMFFLLAIGVGMRVQLSVAVVAMTDRNSSSNPDIPTYDWDNTNVVLSSFYWGYVLLQLIAANLAKIFGTKYCLLGAMLVNSLVSMAVPIMAAEFGSYGVMACRTMQGLSQGFFYPSLYDVLRRWTPITEKARLAAIALSGATFGTIFTMPIVGTISSSWLGWPFSFYLYGGMGVVWMVMFFIFGASSPREHRCISGGELEYIESSMDISEEKVEVPWKSMFSSLPAWGLFIMHIGSTWGYVTLLTETPIYMNKMMGFDIESNGFISAAPYLTWFLLSFVFAWISDYLMNNTNLSDIWNRRLMSAIGSFVPGTALMILSLLPKDAINWSVAMLIIAGGFLAATSSGFMVNHVELSPQFSGYLLAIGNTVGNVGSIFAPLFVQLVVTGDGTVKPGILLESMKKTTKLVNNKESKKSLSIPSWHHKLYNYTSDTKFSFEVRRAERELRYNHIRLIWTYYCNIL
ncbi:unnamed protein product [Phaedon cochleariae]|uniref:Putative inorganic phosphate cotransporter n=1 Tax=Phaedon cochleariae TaxID=80249 RepID=A0A9P0DD08_PHACE|nr:unnamed protein product [Phaedon cochleariae]